MENPPWAEGTGRGWGIPEPMKICHIMQSNKKIERLDYFTLKLAFQRERDRERHFLLVHSPNIQNSQSWSGPKPSIRSIFQVSYMGAGSQDLEPFTATLWSISAENWIGRGASKIRTRMHMGCQYCQWKISLKYY